jgi:ABC-type polysaccharide/polyol phosphate transport system ATPase subunit/capsular polysaccharide biosynthesis protein
MSSIHVENLSIQFRIYHDRSPSLKERFAGLVQKTLRPAFTDFQAIKNISFDIKSGERIGIIGHNGAGKSTLLKALCRIYEIYDGELSIDGRVAPLLEIGAGFHPEFTGRENIYLNGAILGYDKDCLKVIEPEVIAFSELENFIDTPVKYYSTGMYMRLAFSLATAMHPDILILDEIFSGGDAAFMAKAKSRMLSLIDRASIVIMVSHDHELVRSLCDRVLWLDHGIILADGPADEVINQYLGQEMRRLSIKRNSAPSKEAPQASFDYETPSKNEISRAWLPLESLQKGQIALPLPILEICPEVDGWGDFLVKLKRGGFGRFYIKYLRNLTLVRRLSYWFWRNFLPVILQVKSFFEEIRALNKFLPIIQLNEYVKLRQRPLIKLLEEVKVAVPVSKAIPFLDRTTFELHSGEYIFPSLYVAELNKVKVYGGSNLIFTSDSIVSHDLYDFKSDFTSEELHGRHKIDIKRMGLRLLHYDARSINIPVAATFLDACSSNYAHWMSEVLPRIAIFCNHKDYLGIPIIVDKELHPNIMDSLAIITGYDRKIILLPSRKAIRVERLLVMSVVGYLPFEIRKGYVGNRHHGLFNPHALNLIRNKSLLSLNLLPHQTWPQKIYIRRTSGARQVVNFAELEGELLLRGFVCIEPEKLTFVEQVALFANATDIVAPTGAALANAIFCQPSTRICILMSKHKNMIYGYWQSMLATFNLEITHILGDISCNQDFDLHANFYINSDDLRSYLDKLH